MTRVSAFRFVAYRLQKVLVHGNFKQQCCAKFHPYLDRTKRFRQNGWLHVASGTECIYKNCNLSATFKKNKFLLL